MKNIVMAVVAHPDDELLGCGGTLLKHAKDGDDVHIIILSDGEGSRFDEKTEGLEENIEQREGNAHNVSKLIGAKSLNCFKYPDNEMDTVSRLTITKEIENIIDDIEPNIVYTHHVGDVNIDHRRVHEAVITSCRSMPGQFVKTILFFETQSSTEWQPAASNTPFNPNWFVDVSDVWEGKIEALKIYDEEMREWPHSRSYKAVEALANWRGSIVGVEYAEAFMLGRHVK